MKTPIWKTQQSDKNKKYSEAEIEAMKQKAIADATADEAKKDELKLNAEEAQAALRAVAAAKAEAKKEPKPKKEKGPSMAGIFDEVLQKGGTWESILEKVQAEATRLDLKGKVTKGLVSSHFKFRKEKQNKDWAAKLEATETGISVKQSK